MPRGKPRAAKTAKGKAKPSKPSAGESATVTITSKPRRGPPRGSKKMEESEVKANSRKRKQTETAAGEGSFERGQSAICVCTCMCDLNNLSLHSNSCPSLIRHECSHRYKN